MDSLGPMSTLSDTLRQRSSERPVMSLRFSKRSPTGTSFPLSIEDVSGTQVGVHDGGVSQMSPKSLQRRLSGVSSLEISRRGSGERPDAVARLGDEAVYRAHADELIRFASMLVGPSGAEDIVADAVMRVFSSPAWERVESPRPYLYRAVLRQAQTTRRATQRRLDREIRSASGDVATLDTGPLDVDLLVALRSISVRQRAVVFMTHWLDATVDDIASALRVTPRTVQRDLIAAHRKMKEYLQ